MKANANSVVMKEVNVDIVRNALCSEHQATKQRLSEITGLSTVTVGTILNELAADNEVYETDMVPSNGGRPAKNFCYNPERKHVLIIYTHVRLNKEIVFCRVINLFGESVLEHNYTIKDMWVNSFESIIDEMLMEYPSIEAIGFGVPGFEHNDVMIVNDYEHLYNQTFSKHYQSKYSMPVILENDVNLAVLGYCKLHPIKEDPVVYIYFPEKFCPGAGVYINGKLIKGMNSFAGEIKFLPLDIDWKKVDYTDFDSVCTAISKVAMSFMCTISPTQIVLYGDFLTDEHIDRIKQKCEAAVGNLLMPTILVSRDFNFDFEMGLNMKTLELIKSHRTL